MAETGMHNHQGGIAYTAVPPFLSFAIAFVTSMSSGNGQPPAEIVASQATF